MRHAGVAVYIHFVWATWDRLPLLTEALARPVCRAIGAICADRGAAVIAIGGVEDHLHLLVELPATLALADLAKQVKGATAHLVTHELAAGCFFRWQGGYGAVSVSPRHLAEVCDYIARQRDHHAAGALIAEWELPASPGARG